MTTYKLTDNELDRITDSLRGAISAALDAPGKQISRKSPLYRMTAIYNEGYFVISLDIPAAGEVFPILGDKFLPERKDEG